MGRRFLRKRLGLVRGPKRDAAEIKEQQEQLQKKQKGKRSWLDLGDLWVFDADEFAIILGVIAALFVLFFFLEFLIFLLVAAVGITFRTLFRRPWTVAATDPTGVRWTWKVVGYRNAKRTSSEFESKLTAGLSPQSLT